MRSKTIASSNSADFASVADWGRHILCECFKCREVRGESRDETDVERRACVDWQDVNGEVAP